MPRILSSALRVDKNRLQSDHPWSILFQLDIVGAAGPYRLTAHDQDVVFHSQTFTRAPLDVDALEDPTHAALVNLRVTLNNVDQQVIALLETYWAPIASPEWTTTIWQIDTLQPDETPFASGEVFTVQQATTDLLTAAFDLVAEGISLTSILPKRRYTSSAGFPHIPRRG